MAVSRSGKLVPITDSAIGPDAAIAVAVSANKTPSENRDAIIQMIAIEVA